MTVLGCDFSLNGSGLALWNGGVLEEWALFSRTKKLADKFSQVILIPDFDLQKDKLFWVCNRIKQFIIDHPEIKFVNLEQQIGGGGIFSWVDGYGALKYICYELDIPLITTSPTANKSYAGDGRADKNMMEEFLLKEYKIDLSEIGKEANNVVDAAHLAIIGQHFYSRYHLNDIVMVSKKRGTILEKLAIKHKYVEK